MKAFINNTLLLSILLLSDSTKAHRATRMNRENASPFDTIVSPTDFPSTFDAPVSPPATKAPKLAKKTMAKLTAGRMSSTSSKSNTGAQKAASWWWIWLTWGMPGKCLTDGASSNSTAYPSSNSIAHARTTCIQ